MISMMTTRMSENLFCTFAVTGNQPSFQAIFVCNDCFQEQEKGTTNGDEDDEDPTMSQSSSKRTEMAPLCICQGCADSICHEDHDVEYIGMGPATCDCNHLACCKIYHKSIDEAERLGIKQHQQQQIYSKNIRKMNQHQWRKKYLRFRFYRMSRRVHC